MSAVTAAPLSTLAFGDLEDAPWGFVWSQGDAVAVIGGLGAAGDAATVAVELTAAAPDHQWSLTGEGLKLHVTPGHEQLCRVTGELALAGTEGTLDALGVRTQPAALELAELDSLRLVLAWFAPDDAVVLSSARPLRAAGHDQDDVVASVFEPSGALTVDDGRLSTTYTADGAPARMSLELWLEDEEEPYPRRAAGEVIGAGVRAEVAGATLQVHALHCHRGGRDGRGVYVLAQPRRRPPGQLAMPAKPAPR